MIKILKASAGSGKTHALAGTYIDLLLDTDSEGDYAYRNILAVTFTNKATDEMKTRILENLFRKAKDSSDPQRGKAARVLSNILHDYSAFNVSTIDKFFQQTLRAFAHELGHYSSYQVELDKQLLAEEAVDEILDSLDASDKEDREFIDFVLENMQEKLQEGKSPNIEKELKEMALQLKSEAFRVLCGKYGLDPEDAYSTEKLSRLRKSCNAFRKYFSDGLKKRASDIYSAAHNAGLQDADWNRGWIGVFGKIAASGDNFKADLFTDAARRRAADPETWFAKKNAHLLNPALSAVGSEMQDILAFWDSNIKLYNTAVKILGNIYGLGVARRLWTTFDRIQKEKNVVCLDESNGMLKDIIAGSDAPFVFEKVGVRLKHFLLDEFQDTSATQWENFKPLLAESDSNDKRGNKVNNLIVGDVKQSIYRWRDSDWNLLASEVQKVFPRAMVEPLDCNYRSDQAIVKFNNAFYPYAAGVLDAAMGSGSQIADIYKDCYQKLGRPDRQEGQGAVYVSFLDDKKSQPYAVVEAVKSWHARGIPYGEIGVLVRKNDTGTDIAQALIDNGIQVITESALNIRQSLTVRRLVSMLSLVDNPENALNAREAIKIDMEVPTSYHSLCGLCDELYGILSADPRYAADCAAEAVYVTAFVDFLMDYTRSEGNNLHAFLEYWESKDPTVSSPLSADYVKITSIHKSKGLDFPYVIVPFVEDIELYHSGTQAWCCPEFAAGASACVGAAAAAAGVTSGAADVSSADAVAAAAGVTSGAVASTDPAANLIAEASGKLFRVELSSGDENSCFCNQYREERFAQAVDAINMAYVATTRAVHEMLLVGTPGSGKSLSNFATILQNFVNGDAGTGLTAAMPAAPAGSSAAAPDSGSSDAAAASAAPAPAVSASTASASADSSDAAPAAPAVGSGSPDAAAASASTAPASTADGSGSSDAAAASAAPAPAQDASDDASGLIPLAYKVFPLGDRLKVRPYAADFFNADEQSLDTMKERHRGIVLHDVLSKVVKIDDLPGAVVSMVDEGKLSRTDADKVLPLLQKAAKAHPEYFARQKGEKVLLEQDIVNAYGATERPDRVIIGPDGSVLIVDYKFGEDSPAYVKQLERYKNLFKSLGYTRIRAELWFPLQ